jgi:hypothetical protein
VQADPNEYSQLNLRAHSLLADVQLHDVWLAELEGGGPGRTIADALFCFTPQIATSANAAVKRLFAIRRVVGRISGWDRNVSRWDDELYSHRLTDEDRERSRIKPERRCTVTDCTGPCTSNPSVLGRARTCA